MITPPFLVLRDLQAMNVASELLDSQRSLLRELACDVWPRFQASLIYEALCEEIGTAGRYVPHTLTPRWFPNNTYFCGC